MNFSQPTFQNVKCAWLLLKVTYGLLFIAAGADKFMNIITQWDKYLSPMVLENLPVNPTTFMQIIGVAEILLGLTILFVCSRLGGYIAMAWLLIISVNLLAMGTLYRDIAVRDIVMAIGALALARLTAAHESINQVTKR